MTVIEHPSDVHPLTSTGERRLLDAESLRSWGDRVALVAGDRVVTYVELARLVEQRVGELGVGRRLLVLVADRTIDTVVTLLAALDADHVVALVERHDHGEHLATQYGADVTVAPVDPASEERRAGTVTEHHTDPRVVPAERLHPDLALLLGTSGSTGGSKLVRLSRRNLESNAASIAAYLGLTDDDRAITALPLAYCYGLSVVSSHLVVGASVVLSDAAVVDPCFRDALRRHGVTGLAAVPHSLDLVERVGAAELLDVPSLRYVTQAGGRLEPDRVVEFARLGRRLGWEFVVMYGQTEATARMTYLPPGEAERRPDSVGLPVPGGQIEIETSVGGVRPDSGADVGEVVYRGPNVMMGYAESASDLSRGADVDELRTGDLGRLDADGFLEIVGRASRFVKIHGKRVDLDDLERRLSTSDEDAFAVGDDDGLVVVAVGSLEDGSPVADPELHRSVLEAVDLPPGRIVAARIATVPRTTSGKIDRPALLEVVRNDLPGRASAGRGDQGVHDVFADVFARSDIDPAESFASLGGDSFSYVETSIRLEAVLHHLPSDWHLRSIAELEALRPTGTRRRRGVQIETSVVIRAVAILLIVCTHMRLYRLPGGAHTLLAVVGYNFARFQLTTTELADRGRRAVATIARVAVPTSAWIGLNMLLVGGYSLGALLLVNNYTGDAARRGGRWEYWYFEAFVQTMIVLAVLFSIGAVRRAERRAPFAFAMAVLAATLAIRFDVVQWGGEYNEMFRPHTVACFVALGWAAYRSRTVWQRLLVTALTVVTSVGYFGQTDREWRIILMVSALVWIPTLRIPRLAAPLVTTIAAASMWIFLVHWQVWPMFTPWFERHVAFALTIAVGVAVWWAYETLRRRWAAAERGDGWRQRLRRTVGRSTSTHVSAADTATSTSDAKPVAA